jgi:hypothetical protein
MNMSLADQGIEKESFAKVIKMLSPDIMADASSEEVIKAIAIRERMMESTDEWTVPVSRLFSTIDGERKMYPSTNARVNLFEAYSEYAIGNFQITEDAVEAMRPASFEVRSIIAGIRSGDMSDDVLDAANNFRLSRDMDPLKGLETLADMANKAPTLSKMAIGAMAIGGLSAAYRSFSNDPIRTNEFLQYDHPGSKGIARVSMDGTGYDRAMGQSQQQFTPGGASQGTVFKGYSGVVSIQDNLDSMPSSGVVDMMNRR